MTLRKKAIDNNVKNIPEREETREVKRNTIKNKSLPKKNKTKKFHKTMKILLQNY